MHYIKFYCILHFCAMKNTEWDQSVVENSYSWSDTNRISKAKLTFLGQIRARGNSSNSELIFGNMQFLQISRVSFFIVLRISEKISGYLLNIYWDNFPPNAVFILLITPVEYFPTTFTTFIFYFPSVWVLAKSMVFRYWCLNMKCREHFIINLTSHPQWTGCSSDWLLLLLMEKNAFPHAVSLLTYLS